MTTKTKHQIDPLARQDIEGLKSKINEFKDGKIPEERFKAFRLTRGVYGQRQPGVQMFRIKVPGGILNTQQLRRIADLAESFTNGNLHITTRQDIQLHYIHLEDTPAIWESLEEVGITTKEACGNTVRNITASALAGVDPDEPFNVLPYVRATFNYLLRNPICQEMGRKIKIAFSSGKKDSALTFLHDFGFIPRIQNIDGQEVRGFQVWVGGGLGAQAMPARVAHEFLPDDEIIPFIEAGLRVFDRYGEREKRYKARLKFLVDEKRGIGLEEYLRLLNEELKVLNHRKLAPDLSEPAISGIIHVPEEEPVHKADFESWLKTNVVTQKQTGLNVIKIQVVLGNLSSEDARFIAALADESGTGELRLTINQGLYLLNIPDKSLPYYFNRLSSKNFAQNGAETIADITACPGTDTCNLGVTNSTAITNILEDLIRNEYQHLISERDIHIKISGCMNSCGQHMIANIGFHGSSIKNDNKVVPALQVVIGGGLSADGEGLVAEKIIKLPTKRIPDALRLILDDFESYEAEEEYFNRYFQHRGKRYFYDLLKPLADLASLQPDEYIDWGEDLTFIPEIGVGECAGVAYDVVGTIIHDAEEKIDAARNSFQNGRLADAAYHAYSAFVIGAKALLLSEDVHCNTHIGIIQDFDKHFVATDKFIFQKSFQDTVLQKESFNDERTGIYIDTASVFLQNIIAYRSNEIQAKQIIDKFYNA